MDNTKESLRKFYTENMYGIWREGETVSYELLGEDQKKEPSHPFEAVGGELVKITVETGTGSASFIIHSYIPADEDKKQFPKGSPFIVCMHPVKPLDHFLANGYALLVMDCKQVAIDDTEHKGAFYDLNPYGDDSSEQTGVLMAWAWGASKVLDAVYSGLCREFGLDPAASMVTGVSRYGKATAVCGAFDERFCMTIPTCSGAGGLALYSVISEGKTYDFSAVGGPSEYTYGQNEPLDCLQSDSERGWFNDRFLQYRSYPDIPMDQENLPVLAMGRDRYYFIIASYMGEDWVNSPAMWECYQRANVEYEKQGLGDHLAVHFHKEGHAVISEDAELIIRYFNHMYYGIDNGIDIRELKTTVFAGQCTRQDWLEEQEIWDLYDRDGKRTGETFIRGHGNHRNIPEGRYHIVVDILVLHSDGTYLLTKRSEQKDVYPGYWEASAGGSAVRGEEPLTAAERELFEETGLRADSMELINVLFKDTSRALFYSYIARVNCDKSGIILQEGETTDYKWVDKAGLLEYIDSDEAIKSHNQRFEKYINTIR